MKILFLGDVMGRAGRDAINKNLTNLRNSMSLDFVIVNAENATSGFGLSISHAKEILDSGADCLTLGDHAFDQKDMISGIVAEPRIIRPINLAKTAPGKGAQYFDLPDGRKILVIQVLGQVFMKRVFEDPFNNVDKILKANPLSKRADAIILDIHAEATSEKMAMGHWCDGRVSLVIGTHTHVPTSDTMILSNGTGYQSDAGMCGDYNSVIGMEPIEPIQRFVNGMVKNRFTPASGEATLSGVLLETDDASGLAKSLRPVRIGGRLYESQ